MGYFVSRFPSVGIQASTGETDGFGSARFGKEKEEHPRCVGKCWRPPVHLDLGYRSGPRGGRDIIEPGGKDISWENPKGMFGGELNGVDNEKGFGPENIYWPPPVEGTDPMVTGQAPLREYKWFVVYWGGFGGISKPTVWKVRIKHDGNVRVVTGNLKSINERSRMFTLKVALPSHGSGDAASPADRDSRDENRRLAE